MHQPNAAPAARPREKRQIEFRMYNVGFGDFFPTADPDG